MSTYGPTLERLERLQVRLYQLTTESHLAIGSGEAAAELRPVDKPIIRALIWEEANPQGKRLPYIPASSLHGVWRAWVEKALRSKNRPADLNNILNLLAGKGGADHFDTLRALVLKDLNLPSDGPYLQLEDGKLKDDTIPREWQVYAGVCNLFWEHDRCDLPVGDDAQKPAAKAKEAWFAALGRPKPCPVCSLFGFTGQRGRVRFTHAFPGLADPAQLPLDIITRVAIDRYTGAASSGKLFDLEAVPPGVHFYFFVILENLRGTKEDENYEESLFKYGETALNLNLATLGAHATVGFGAVKLTLKRCWCLTPQIFDFPWQDIPEDAYKSEISDLPGFQPRFYPSFFCLLAQGNNSKHVERLKKYGANLLGSEPVPEKEKERRTPCE